MYVNLALKSNLEASPGYEAKPYNYKSKYFLDDPSCETMTRKRKLTMPVLLTGLIPLPYFIILKLPVPVIANRYIFTSDLSIVDR